MYEKEWLPTCILIGISPEQFWKMNPRKLQPYYDAEKMREERLDTHMWLMGKYVCDGVGIAVGNVLRSKGKKPLPYLEKPYMSAVKEHRGELTEEEKMKKVNAIFNSLQIMKVNYELEQKQKQKQSAPV